MIKNIKNYDEIIIKNNSLIILDIDETIIKFNTINSTWWNDIKKYYELYHNKEKADNLALQDWINIISNEKPELLDEELFLDLLNRIELTNSKLILLTARDQTLNEITIQNIKDCNINIDSNNIYHSYPKGLKVLELYNSHNYNNIIFVDDKLDNIKDVQDKLKNNNINLYLITHQNYH